MEASPSRPTYRIAGRAVTFAALVFVSFCLSRAQVAQRSSVSKGPRAVGLLRLHPDGKAELIPVSIMVDGKFFDANAYKAAPVPMALESGTVYEAERTGDSLGFFTVTQVMQQKNSFIGNGKWRPAGFVEPSIGMKAEASPREAEDKPPTLRRGGSSATQPDKEPTDSKADKTGSPTTTKPAPPAPADDDDRPRLKSSTPSSNDPPKDQTSQSTAPQASQTTATTSAPASSPADSEPEPEDPSRPKLRRGKQSPVPAPKTSSSPKPAAKSAAGASTTESSKKDSHAPVDAPAAAAGVQVIPAISDANGPEPRPYSYDMKPKEEQSFRKKILGVAAEEVWKQAQLYDPSLAAAGGPSSRPRKGTNAASKTPQPTFEDVKLRVFDVATNNEPILVLTATATYPQRGGKGEASGQPAPSYYITLVAHSDMYGELRKLLSAVTDDRHLDVSPRMSLVDAVDADGDGRAELLFEQVYDTGKTYVIYRVGADQLWARYQGTPGGHS